MLHRKSHGVNYEATVQPTPRILVDIIRPQNAPGVIAGHVLDEPNYRLLRSEGTNRIHHKSNSILFDADVLNRAEAMGVTVVEVGTTGHTYSATMTTIRQHGRYVGTRYGLQIGLHLRYWSTDGTLPAVETPAADEPTDSQLSLFGVRA